MNRKLLLLAAALCTAPPVFAAPAWGHAAAATCSMATHGEHTSGDLREIAWMQKGKEAVRDRLKDGPSARFKNVYFCRGAKNVPMACGYVNGKNSFGGYGGFERFISAGKPDLTYLETEVSAFSSVWKMFCR